MLRRSFLQLVGGLVGAVAAGPLISPLETFTPAAVPVLAVEMTTPYWLLELQAFQRLHNQALSDMMEGVYPRTPAGQAWRPTFPTHPKVDA